jgi:Flp pilus assembly protein TadD
LRGARSELQEALARLPREPRIYNLLGVIDAQEKHFTAAETNFRRAIQLAPRFTGAYLNLGRLYQENANQQGAVEKALDVYRKLLESEPDHVEANYQAAWLLSRLGKFGPSLDQLGGYRRRRSSVRRRSHYAVSITRLWAHALRPKRP